MGGHWETLPLNQSGLAIHHSTATVNSLHSSSHSSSSNQSSGEAPQLTYSLGSHSSMLDREHPIVLHPPKNSRANPGVLSGPLSDVKGTSFSQPYLNSTGIVFSRQ